MTDEMTAFIAALKAHIQDHADFRKRALVVRWGSSDWSDGAEEGRTEGLEMAIEDIDEFVAKWVRNKE